MVAKYQEQLAQLVKNRKCKVGVEVGVHAGKFSQYLLANTDLELLYSIDCWEENAENKEPLYTYNETIGRLKPFGERSKIIKGYSVEIAKTFADHSLDFIYLDALHDYEPVIEDMTAWINKLTHGGIFSGDDYDWDGVKKAVDEKLPMAIILGNGDTQPQWYIIND